MKKILDEATALAKIYNDNDDSDELSDMDDKHAHLVKGLNGDKELQCKCNVPLKCFITLITAVVLIQSLELSTL